MEETWSSCWIISHLDGKEIRTSGFAIREKRPNSGWFEVQTNNSNVVNVVHHSHLLLDLHWTLEAEWAIAG